MSLNPVSSLGGGDQFTSFRSRRTHSYEKKAPQIRSGFSRMCEIGAGDGLGRQFCEPSQFIEKHRQSCLAARISRKVSGQGLDEPRGVDEIA